MHSDDSQQYRNARRVQGAYADWLRPREWDHVVHVSLPEGCSEAHAWAAFARGVRRLDTWTQRRVDWLCAVERGRAGGLPHFHALLYGTGALADDRVDDAWRDTSAVRLVQRYDPARGAVAYIAKEAGTERGDVQLSRCLPPLRAPRS